MLPRGVVPQETHTSSPPLGHAAFHVQVEYIKGWGKLKSATQVEVSTVDGGTSVLAAKNIIIATGSEVTPLPGVPVEERRCDMKAAPRMPMQAARLRRLAGSATACLDKGCCAAALLNQCVPHFFAVAAVLCHPRALAAWTGCPAAWS